MSSVPVSPSLSDSTFLSVSLLLSLPLCSVSLPPPCLPPPSFPSLIQVRAEGSHQWQLRALLDQIRLPLMAVVGKIRPRQDSLWLFLGLWLQTCTAEHFSVLRVSGVCENRTLVTDQGREAPGCCTELLREEREEEGGSSSIWCMMVSSQGRQH